MRLKMLMAAAAVCGGLMGPSFAHEVSEEQG